MLARTVEGQQQIALLEQPLHLGNGFRKTLGHARDSPTNQPAIRTLRRLSSRPWPGQRKTAVPEGRRQLRGGLIAGAGGRRPASDEANMPSSPSGVCDDPHNRPIRSSLPDGHQHRHALRVAIQEGIRRCSRIVIAAAALWTLAAAPAAQAQRGLAAAGPRQRGCGLHRLQRLQAGQAGCSGRGRPRRLDRLGQGQGRRPLALQRQRRRRGLRERSAERRSPRAATAAARDHRGRQPRRSGGKAEQLCAAVGSYMEDLEIVATVDDALGDYLVWLKNGDRRLLDVQRFGRCQALHLRGRGVSARRAVGTDDETLLRHVERIADLKHSRQLAVARSPEARPALPASSCLHHPRSVPDRPCAQELRWPVRARRRQSPCRPPRRQAAPQARAGTAAQAGRSRCSASATCASRRPSAAALSRIPGEALPLALRRRAASRDRDRGQGTTR